VTRKASLARKALLAGSARLQNGVRMTPVEVRAWLPLALQ
jgi:hypothetical protein